MNMLFTLIMFYSQKQLQHIWKNNLLVISHIQERKFHFEVELDKKTNY